MRNLFLFFFLSSLWSQRAEAQITLEHVYPFPVLRERIDGAGERYVRTPYRPLDSTWVVELYGSNHQLQQSTPIVLSASTNNTILAKLSADFFDTDPGVEVVFWNYTDGNGVYDDNGTKLSGNLSNGPVSLITYANGAKRLLAGDSVYTVPGYTLEHAFTPGMSPVGFAHLAQAGDKYYQFDENGNLVLYNTDYSVFQTYNSGVPVSEITWFRNCILWDQYRFNGDDAIEWQLTYTLTGGINQVTRFYSGSTQLCQHNFEYSGTQSTLLPEEWAGLNGPKSVYTISSGIAELSKTSTVDILTGVVEYNSGTGSSTYGNSFSDGLKYWTDYPTGGMTSVQVLNTDQSVWATFPVTSADQRLSLPTNDIFDTNAATKEIVVRNKVSPNFIALRAEDGSTIYNFDTCNNFQFSRLVNLPNKFLGRRVTGGVVKAVHVYGLPSFGPVSDTRQPQGPPSLVVKAFPNPFTGPLVLDLSGIPGEKAAILVYDLSGRQVIAHTNAAAGTHLSLPETATLSPGAYWVRVNAANGQYGWCKVEKL